MYIFIAAAGPTVGYYHSHMDRVVSRKNTTEKGLIDLGIGACVVYRINDDGLLTSAQKGISSDSFWSRKIH